MIQSYKVVPNKQQDSNCVTKQKSNLEPYNLKQENWIQTGIRWIQVALKLSPAFLGIFDGVTDITYYLSQPFAHYSIQQAFLSTLIFTPFALAVIWDISFTKQDYKKRDKTSLLSRQQRFFTYQRELENLKRNGHSSIKLIIKSQLLLVQTYLVETFIFIFYMVKNSFMALIYAFLQEIKILPFFITFKDPILSQIQFPITKPLVAEFTARRHLFKQETDIRNKNTKITNNNKIIKEYNEMEQNLEHQKPIKQLLPMPQVYRTHPQKAAQIMNSHKSCLNSLLTDPYVSNFLELTQLIKAVFQSLPMLIIQYINNSELNIWSGKLNIFSFLLSVVMVIVSSIQMINTLSKQETFPLLKFKSYVEQDIPHRGQNPLWLLQYNTDEEFQIYDIETLEYAAFANENFYKSIKGIRIDVTSDPDFIIKSIKGPLYPFQCLHNIILNMTYENDFHMQFSDNESIESDHLNILFNALQEKTLNRLTIQGNDLSSEVKENNILVKFITQLMSSVQCRKVILHFDDNKINFNEQIYFAKDLEELDFSLQYSIIIIKRKNRLTNVDFLEGLQYCDKLQTLKLGLGQNIRNPFKNYTIKDIKSLEPIFSLPLLKNFNLNLLNNDLQLNVINFAEFSMIESLTLHLNLCSQTDLSFFEQAERMTKLKELNLALKYEIFNTIKYKKMQDIKGMQFLGKCKYLQSITLQIGNDIQTIEPVSCLQNFSYLKSLNLNFYDNEKITNLDQLAVIKNIKSLQTLNLNFTKNSINSIEVFQQFEDIIQLENFSLYLGANEIESIESISFLKNFNYIQILDLDFSRNSGIKNIDSISVLKNSGRLTSIHLNFNYCSLDSIEVFSCFCDNKVLNNLSLDLQNNNIVFTESLCNLKGLTNLQSLNLNLRNNPIQDISCVSNFKSLTNLQQFQLDLEETLITDVNPVRQLNQIPKFQLWIKGQYFTEQQTFLNQESGLKIQQIQL